MWALCIRDRVGGDAALEGLTEPRGIVALGVEGLGRDLPFELRIEKEEVGGRAGLEGVDRQVEHAGGLRGPETDEICLGKHTFADKPVGDGQGEILSLIHISMRLRCSISINCTSSWTRKTKKPCTFIRNSGLR